MCTERKAIDKYVLACFLSATMVVFLLLRSLVPSVSLCTKDRVREAGYQTIIAAAVVPWVGLQSVIVAFYSHTHLSVVVFQKLLKPIHLACKMGHYRPASETPLMAFRWRADSGPIMNTGWVSAQFQRLADSHIDSR